MRASRWARIQDHAPRRDPAEKIQRKMKTLIALESRFTYILVDCVSVLWAHGDEKLHHVLEFGVAAAASASNALLETPKEHAHAVERGDETNARTAVAAFEHWRGAGDRKRKAD